MSRESKLKTSTAWYRHVLIDQWKLLTLVSVMFCIPLLSSFLSKRKETDANVTSQKPKYILYGSVFVAFVKKICKNAFILPFLSVCMSAHNNLKTAESV
jgi:hypothetical protein